MQVRGCDDPWGDRWSERVEQGRRLVDVPPRQGVVEPELGWFAFEGRPPRRSPKSAATVLGSTRRSAVEADHVRSAGSSGDRRRSLRRRLVPDDRATARCADESYSPAELVGLKPNGIAPAERMRGVINTRPGPARAPCGDTSPASRRRGRSGPRRSRAWPKRTAPRWSDRARTSHIERTRPLGLDFRSILHNLGEGSLDSLEVGDALSGTRSALTACVWEGCGGGLGAHGNRPGSWK